MRRKNVEVTTKPAPRNTALREVPFMGLNVATVFKDTSGDGDRPNKDLEAERIRRAREKRERRSQQRAGG